jgi:hypothetical protein
MVYVDTITINDFDQLKTMNYLLGIFLQGTLMHSSVTVPPIHEALWNYIGEGDWNKAYRSGDFVLRRSKEKVSLLAILKEVACTIYAHRMKIGPSVYYISVENISKSNKGSEIQRLQRGSGTLSMITESFDMDLKQNVKIDHGVLMAIHECLKNAGTFLHCDLKRSNMLLKYENDTPIVKMTDFDGDLCFILEDPYKDIIYILHSIMLIGEIKCDNDMERFHDLNHIINTHITTLRIPNSIWKIFSIQFITYINKNTAQKYIRKLHKFYEYYIQKCLPKIEQIDDLLKYADMYTNTSPD